MAQFIGELISISKDIVKGGYNLIFSTNEIPSGVNDITGQKLTITAKKYRRKDKIAKALCSTSEEIYEELLQKYGYPLYDEEDNPVILSLKADIDTSVLDIHLKMIGEGHVQGKLFKHYKVIRGQSAYDTKEMSTFIDGIVSEAKELDIETLTPDEIERMKAAWKA